MRQGIEIAIKAKIQENGRGWCFTAMDFEDLGSNDAIRRVLSLLQKEKWIRRLAQGIYDYPKELEGIGTVPPSLTDVAKAIAEKNGVKIQPAGAHAANLSGLSEQVPGRIVFLTDGPSRKIKIGNREIIFKKTTSKVMFAAGTREGLIIQAFKNLGQDQIDDVIRARTRKFLASSSAEEIRRNIKYAPVWVKKLILEIMEIKP
jgi:hypothetical protein